MFDFATIKKDFPIFKNHKELVYLDSAATSQKPQVVIDQISQFYSQANANVHRGIYSLSEQATEAYDQARQQVASFIGAQSSRELIFTKGSTDGLNLVAQSYGLAQLKAGDKILVSDFEHHSNFLPWQRVCQQTGAVLEILQSEADGIISQQEWQAKLSHKTKIVAIAHASNVMGTINDIQAIAKMVHQVGAILVVDGAQAVPHLPIDVQALDCDVYAFSGHKMLAPMGIGALYIREEILATLAPYQLGGGMIESVTIADTVFTTYPEKFEAGTPNVAGALALAVATKYLQQIGLVTIREHEVRLSQYLLDGLARIKGVELLGAALASARTGLVSFHVAGVHAHDLSDFLSHQGLALRAGFHCAQPLHESRHVGATLRASYYLYNNQTDLEFLLSNLQEAINYYTT